MKYTYLIITIFIVTLISFFPSKATAEEKSYSIDDVPNVHLDDKREFISDPSGLISPSAKDNINRQIRDMMDQTTAEMAVVLLPSIGDQDPYEFGVRLFEKWKIGKRDKDNGLLMLVVMDQRQAKVITGYGLEGILPDADVTKIARATMNEKMRAGDIDGAVQDAVAAYSAVILNPENAEEIKSKFGNDEENIDAGELKSIMLGLCGLVLLFSTLMFFINLYQLRGRDNFSKAANWRSLKTMFLILGILSLGTGVIWWILTIILYRHYRNKRLTCEVCGAKMNKLSEEDDNEFLTASQDFEERLGTVDYDVWTCPDCYSVVRLPFVTPQSEYSRCEKCGTIARHLVSDTVLRPATTRTAGIGVKRYHCDFCGNDDNQNYTIPKKADAVVIGAAAGAAAGAMNRGGGGFSGGSFGGGFTGGGGGGTSW